MAHSVPLLVAAALVAFYVLRSGLLRPYLTFFWHCFIRPIPGRDQKSRLDEFYAGQALVYDSTRNGLLRGRRTMLGLSAAHLRALRAKSPEKRLVWVDIGGGTGYNIELMDSFFPISQFDAVYVIDLCNPLLEVARKRFAARGWTNVTVLCQDAAEFSLPEWTGDRDPKGSVSFISLSYSLSMIPSFYPVLDRIDHVLDPQNGLLSVVDFYTAGKHPSLHEKAIGGVSKECGWLSRWFWQVWFDFDHVSLSPARRSYLEYKFGTIKSYNGRNKFVVPFIVRIPYYIWLGRSRSCVDVASACHAFEVEGGNTIGNCSPVALKAIKEAENVPSLQIGEPALALQATVIDIAPPFSSFHYHVNSEDPFEDMKHLQLSSDDSMLVITSAGDNALHYVATAGIKRIHCVDMNPCQGHLLELKLAAIKSLDHNDFFALFGAGKHANFRGLLDTVLAPHLSSSAYQFWRVNSNAFSSSFYLRGYSGWALRLASWIFRLAGVTKDIQALCNAENLQQQQDIWQQKLRPVLLNPVVVSFVVRNPVFLWNALGVPVNQTRMLLDEGSVYEFVRDTLEPLASSYLFKNDNYFYLLVSALLGHYTAESCPEYLTRRGFEALKSKDGAALDAFRLHTDSIVNVLRGLAEASLTRSLVMDSMDWFPPGSKELEEEVAQFHRVLAPGGCLFWRSAARLPWYNARFEAGGFTVTCLGVRKGPEAAIDRVNMYASFWRAVRL
ncbi:hypothetical protein MIND_00050600 [Mycena indigotica]|uniref:Betaine lipid synthase n=1 Tax=Mycena indigotica TaxID=2126181 RepID=A0A8H6TDA4_9AGAR|nr:uncharacterized protein MIND_00050600 [Mycena indigotica]KAF7315360.1 hypothetical protein MIND_00050600 [Mycena indigotica]